MPTTPQHTPTLRIQEINGFFYVRPNQADDRSPAIAVCSQLHDAESIVENDRRRRAFEPMRESLAELIGLLDEINPPSGPFWSGANAVKRARAALALAEEKRS